MLARPDIGLHDMLALRLGVGFFFFFFFGLQGNCLFSVSKKLPQTPDEPDLCQNSGLDTVHLSDQS